MIGSVVSSAIKQVGFGSTAETKACPLHPLKGGHAQIRHQCLQSVISGLSVRQVISCSSRHHRSGHRPSCRKSPSRRARPRRVAATSRCGILHNRFTERSTLLALKVSQLFAPIHVRLRGYDAVRRVGAPHIKITVLKATLAFVEHIKCFRLVLFNRGKLGCIEPSFVARAGS